MTVICFFIGMAADLPVLMYLLAMVCDTALLLTAMLTGVIHR